VSHFLAPPGAVALAVGGLAVGTLGDAALAVGGLAVGTPVAGGAAPTVGGAALAVGGLAAAAPAVGGAAGGGGGPAGGGGAAGGAERPPAAAWACMSASFCLARFRSSSESSLCPAASLPRICWYLPISVIAASTWCFASSPGTALEKR